MRQGISDATATRVLSVYAGMTQHVVADPRRWLGWGSLADVEEAGDRSVARRAVSFVSDHVLGQRHPGSPGWEDVPVEDRVTWWVGHAGALVAFVAASPRFFGLAADRLPLQAAFGAAAQGLVICATAHEHGVDEPGAWVPLLGKVLFDRELTRPDDDALRAGSEMLDDSGKSDVSLQKNAPSALSDVPEEPDPEATAAAHPGFVRTAARTVWRLARALISVEGLLDERPRGALPFRALGKVPVVGVVGGFLDERGGIRKAARETSELIDRSR